MWRCLTCISWCWILQNFTVCLPWCITVPFILCILLTGFSSVLKTVVCLSWINDPALTLNISMFWLNVFLCSCERWNWSFKDQTRRQIVWLNHLTWFELFCGPGSWPLIPWTKPIFFLVSSIFFFFFNGGLACPCITSED